ncbi:MAG: thiamine phosphate synthase [Akkermansia sp.]
MMNRLLILKSCRLYGILDLGYVELALVEEIAEALLRGGVKILQVRAKNVPLETVKDVVSLVVPLCRKYGCLSIVNDYPELADEYDADGVHIGQDTPDFSAVRTLIGADKIIGRSTHSVEQALQGYAEGADYIGFGPLFPTATKPGRLAIGLEGIAEVRRCLPVEFPVFCIGGINETSLPAVLAAGAQRVVIVSWLLTHPQVEVETKRVIALLTHSSVNPL